MRIARVLAETNDECSPAPRVALERDGALYDVATLDEVFGTAFSPERLPNAWDFHTRVVALAGAGLDTLDDRLRSGDRPSQARLLPGTFVWLPPCDTDRALLVQMAAYEVVSAEPLHSLGNARGLLGHEANVPFPAEEDHPSFELGIAAVLGDDLRGASVVDAQRAILGYAILNGWTGRDEAAQRPPGSRRVPAQMGPVLVTAGEIDEVVKLRAQARAGGKVIADTHAGGWGFPIAESIAWVSRWIDLRAGDVIGAGCMRSGSAAVRYGVGVEMVVERMGKLGGRAVRGA